MLVLTVIYIYPIIRTAYFSFFNVPFGGAVGDHVGFGNYIALFQSPDFCNGVRVNLTWAFGNLFLQLNVAFIIAVLVNQAMKGMHIVRTMVLLPWIIPTAAVGSVIRWILLPHLGIVNELLLRFGLTTEPVNFLGNHALPTLIVLNSWMSIPIGVLLILSALQTIPKDVYEAAQVDGANTLQVFFKITFPTIGKMLWFTSFLIFVWAFNSFDMIWMVTQGGPGIATQTLPVMVYRSAFRVMQLGMSSTISMVIATFLFIVGVLYFSILGRGAKEDE
jgi:multiple sugar transport system permease protein